MRRVKVISEATDLVPVLRAFDSDLKRRVFHEILADWRTPTDIAERYGEEGVAALVLFEKTKIVDTRWEPTPDGPQKAYRSYYTTFQLSAQVPAEDMGDILAVAMMPEREFLKLEAQVLHLVESDLASLPRLSEKLDLTPTRLRSIVKRSSRLASKGHVVQLLAEEKRASAPSAPPLG